MPFNIYLQKLRSVLLTEATEHTHRPALQTLLETFASKGQRVLHEPKREGKFGSPDFKITQTETIVGYVENKKLGENLDKTLKSEQIKKYQSLSDNLLITNYLEWIWLREGKVQQRESLAFATDLEQKNAAVDPARQAAVRRLLEGFFSQPPREIADVKKLAEALALRARLLKDFLLDELQRQEKEKNDGRLFQLYATFREHIFNELTIAEFADAFAQNLVYGLFLARLNARHEIITLYTAKRFIPQSFNLIRELVAFLDELEQPEYQPARWIVEEVLSIMNSLDLGAISDSLSFSKKKKTAANFATEDPFLYFYEPFLAAYDPKLREQRGVYYTPPPVVNFIVRATDQLLRRAFGIREGLADRSRVTVLDFATGTGTFLLQIIRTILESLPPDSGKRDLLVREHILRNLFGFEYLIAPYTIAHLKLSQYLRDAGYEMQAGERLQIFLTNTLEPIDKQIKIPFLPALSEESRQAQRVKDTPVLVITGNPPYSYVSKNNGAWISEKIRDYYFVDGQKLKERNPKGLQDDYVKFIRFAQDKMDAVEQGIVAIITNHRFLVNPTFRGMRQSLMKSFDQIWLLDLHGSNKPKESPPGGGPDENVFDIEQGVSISFFVKKAGLEKKICHADLWGSRADKYRQCLENDLDSIVWEELRPTAPFYLFRPMNEILKVEYEKYWSVKELFRYSNVGIMTSRDAFVLDFDRDELLKRIQILKNLTVAEANQRFGLSDTREKKLEHSIREINAIPNLDGLIRPIAIHPFDQRFVFYSKSLVRWPVEELMRHFLNTKNKGFSISRQLKSGFHHIFAVNDISAYNLIDSAGSFGRGYVFPFYLVEDDGSRTANLTASLTSFLSEKYPSEKLSPEEIFGYLYAVLHSPAYRSKYVEFLKIDFPRIPFPADIARFHTLSALGDELVQAHLMEREADYPFGHYIGQGNHVVAKLGFPEFVADPARAGTGRLHINATQYFDAVPEAVWRFQIGGYPVLEKYLKDRRGREILHEAEHIERIVRALAFTIDQMQLIDNQTIDWI